MCELDNTHPLKVNGDVNGPTGVPYTGFLADVSNDGKTFSSNPALYVIHDAKCMECRPLTGSCKVKVSLVFFCEKFVNW